VLLLVRSILVYEAFLARRRCSGDVTEVFAFPEMRFPKSGARHIFWQNLEHILGTLRCGSSRELSKRVTKRVPGEEDGLA
jgi:hypothetical protein